MASNLTGFTVPYIYTGSHASDPLPDNAPPANAVPPSIFGQATPGGVILSNNGIWTGRPDPSFTRQWRADGIPIPGATDVSLVVDGSMLGALITCRVTATNTMGTASENSNVMVVNEAASAPTNIVAPAITGSSTVGSVLTCTPGSWAGSPAPAIAYQWTLGGGDIAGETGNTLTTGAPQVGLVIGCRVTATNIAGMATAVSNTVTVQPAPALPLNTAAPIITGNTATGSTLSTTSGTWIANPAPTYSIQWRRDGNPIVGATNPTYVTVLADEGHAITTRITATNAHGSAGANSNVITPVAGGTAPFNTAAPVISGSTTQGATLTTTTGSWTGDQPITYTYQWRRATSNIAGATSSSYATQPADVGQAVTCRVTATNGAGSLVATSNALTIVVAPVAPVNTVLPTITGTASVGSTLTATNGTWTGTPTPTYTREWRRNGNPIAGATGLTYVLANEDAGTTITVRVSATNSAGTVAATSAATATIAAPPAAPVNVTAPFVSGLAAQGSTLTCSTGTWSGSPTPTYAYQWRRAGSPISGATAATYVSVAGDVGVAITCTVTATNTQGNASQVSSNSITPTATGNVPVLFYNSTDGVITNGGLSYHRAPGTWTRAHAYTDTGAVGKKYVELRLNIIGGEMAVAIYGGTNLSPPQVATGIGFVSGEPGISAYVIDQTAWNFGANGGNVTGTIATNMAAGIPFSVSMGLCIDADTRRLWFRMVGQTGWWGGGDPVAGTSPSVTFAGTAPIRLGFMAYGDDSTADILLAAQYGDAIPAGFTAWDDVSAGTAPVNVTPPAVTGAAPVGSLLTSTQGTWSGSPTPTYAYQWRRGTSDIPGATSATYTTVTADVGLAVTCRVTATNTAGVTPATSNAINVTGASGTAPVNTVAPSITGNATQGNTLTCTNGTWTGTPTPTFTYQWRRGAGNISGANANTYVTVPADVGQSITCRVTGSNSAGNADGTSNAITVTAPPATPPVNTLAPVVSGGTEVGMVLTTTNGSWTGTPAPTFAYQWYRNSSPISGATANTYTNVAGDLNQLISCTVTATNSAGNASSPSNQVTIVTYARWANPLPSLTIEPGGLIAHKNGDADPPHYGHCNMTSPLAGQVYFEVDVTFNSPYGNASVVNFYGGTLGPSDYLPTQSVGQMWGEPGVAIGLTSEWVAITFANYGMGTNEVAENAIYTFARTPFPVTRRFQFAVNVATRSIWFRTTDGPVGWVGGGDPVAGTAPTVIINGSNPIYVGATSARPANTLRLILPNEFANAPPSGFVAGILEA